MDSLLAVDKRAVGEFFAEAIVDEVPTHTKLDEIKYVASILAHFALTSCSNVDDYVSTPRNLTEVLDRFVLSEYVSRQKNNSEILVIAGAQSLLLAGFFRRQMRARRHDVRFYDSIGGEFYKRASYLERSPAQQDLYSRLGRGFQNWTKACQRVSATLHENQNKRYFLNFPEN